MQCSSLGFVFSLIPISCVYAKGGGVALCRFREGAITFNSGGAF